MAPTPFSWEVRNLGVKVAALMTPEIIRRRLGPLARPPADRRAGPLQGRPRGARRRSSACRSSAGRRSSRTCPSSSAARPAGATSPRHDCRIFAEIVEAPALGVDEILARAAALRAEGADVIDLGCLPDTPFPHLEEAVQALKARGLAGQRRFRRSGGAAARRAGRRRLPAQPDRGDARPRLRDRRRAGADPGPPRRAGRPGARPASGCCGRAGRSSPTRSSTRSISASPTSIVPLPRAAAPPARGRDADGRGQPHRAHRRRHHRHHHDAAWAWSRSWRSATSWWSRSARIAAGR